MAHIRKLLRDSLTTALTGLASTGNRVYQTRVYPLAANKLPGILIYSKEESTEYSTMGLPRIQERTVSFNVEVYVKGVSGYDNSIDQICLEIEEALYANITLGGNAANLTIRDFSADFSGNGDQPVGLATITVDVLYRVNENAPDAAI
jgi:hypothetical protein